MSRSQFVSVFNLLPPVIIRCCHVCHVLPLARKRLCTLLPRKQSGAVPLPSLVAAGSQGFREASLRLFPYCCLLSAVHSRHFTPLCRFMLT